MERMRITEEVARALAAHRGVVALESTVVTHGLPSPDGVRVAREMEASVTRAGAVPATIGLLDGQVRVGLSAEELDRLAATPRVPKVNLSNFAATLVAPGSTICTMRAAGRSSPPAALAVGTVARKRPTT